MIISGIKLYSPTTLSLTAHFHSQVLNEIVTRMCIEHPSLLSGAASVIREGNSDTVRPDIKCSFQRDIGLGHDLYGGNQFKRMSHETMFCANNIMIWLLKTRTSGGK